MKSARELKQVIRTQLLKTAVKQTLYPEFVSGVTSF